MIEQFVSNSGEDMVLKNLDITKVVIHQYWSILHILYPRLEHSLRCCQNQRSNIGIIQMVYMITVMKNITKQNNCILY